MTRSLPRLASALFLCLACSPARAPSTPASLSGDEPRDVPEEVHEPVPDDVVARAEGPVRVIRLSDGVELSSNAVARELLQYDAVCAGEEHTSAPQHYAELWLLDRLGTQAPYLGLELGAGFEMWQTKDQGLVDAFADGTISEKRLLKRTDYKNTWGYDFAYYRPILLRARELSLPVIALNASKTTTAKIRKGGLAALGEWKTSQLPELDLSDREHRADFERRMKKHPGVEAENLDNYYAAQVVWDETMANTSVRWLNRHTPVRRIFIVAGQAHCQRSAIPKRVVRRGVPKAAALLLTTKRPSAEASKQYDYAVVVEASE
ncbi:MAG TPA: ChaN family lipoprotein [Polyangiaceae bacterium]|nr:ChaN family lipoprotein [Polyangiaceae bacterium]